MSTQMKKIMKTKRQKSPKLIQMMKNSLGKSYSHSAEHNANDIDKIIIDVIKKIMNGTTDENPVLNENEEIQVSPKKITKKLYIGWMHKASQNENCYKQMREPLGGIKKIEIDCRIQYSIDDIKKLSVEAMQNEFNENILKNSSIKLANINEVVFESFTNLNGQNCEFWEFANQKLKSKCFRLQLLLLSTTRTNTNEGSNDEKRGQLSICACEGEKTLNVPIIAESDLKFIDRNLGEGAFGCVRLATWNGTEVAVKCLKSNYSIKYLIREIKVMDSIRHPNIISIMSVCLIDKHAYIVMEYFKSITLRSYISKLCTLLDYDIRKNANYFISLQICKAIAYLHNLSPSIIHKDIKPENILINQELVIKICDLGMSKTSNLSSTLHTTVGHNFGGTPTYMAPEILIDIQPATTKSDIWSLACCIVELFSERTVWEIQLPSSIDDLRHTILKLKKPKSLEYVPTAIQPMLSSCFEHEPSRRPNALMLLQLFKRLYKE